MQIIKEKSENNLVAHIRTYDISTRSSHWHENYEICFPIDNNLKFLIDGKLIEAKKGDIVTISEQTIHRFIVESNNTSVLVVQFPMRILLNSDFPIAPLKVHITKEEIAKEPELKEKIDTICKLLKSEKYTQNFIENPFFQALSISLYTLLMRNFPSEYSKDKSNNDRLIFYKVVEYINNNFKNNINIKSISSSLYIQPRKLSSLFLKYTGINIIEYINVLRIKNANILLSQGYTVTEAAMESGFQCIRTFNNSYKNYMSTTPTNFVNQKTW